MASIKRGKWERAAAKRAAADPAAIPPSPPPDQQIAMVKSGIDINRGNANQIPLSDVGHSEAQQRADQFAAKGGVDQVVIPTSERAKESAAPIIAANPQAQVKSDPNLEAHAQGNLEGQPMDMVKGQLRDLMKNNPQRIIPGQGALSSRKGESFDQARLRILPAIRGVMQQLAEGMQKNPDHKIVVPIHSSVIKLTKAWLANGAPDDFSVNPSVMDKETSETPGGVDHLFPNKRGEWETNEVNMRDPQQLGAGIYLLRHAPTPINKETYEQGAAQQQALAQMHKHIQSGDFRRAKSFAEQASKAGMSDQDIEKYVDNAIPDRDTVSQYPMPRLLATIAAAGPQKKQELAPLLQSHFGNIDQLPEDVRGPFAEHLAQIAS